MRVFGNPIGITVGDSASLATGSIFLNTPLEGISFLYFDPNYATGSNLTTESLANIDVVLTSTSSEGPLGELVFRLKKSSNPSAPSSTILRAFYTGSNDDPRLGLGFEENEPILTEFDIKSKKDSAEGTELFLRGSRTTKGAEVGDSAGSIYFIIESGSYNTGSKEQFIQSGSVASIGTKVTEVNENGTQGHFVINVGRSNTEANRALWTMGYGADPRVSGNMGSITTGSLNIVRTNPIIDDMLTLTHTDDSYISLQYITGSTSSDTVTTIDSFTTSSYSGVIYDYTLVNPGNGARTGQIMVIWDNGNVEMTDVSTPSLGSFSPPSFTTTLSGVSNNIFNLKITSGSNYSFKAFVKKI